jgi:thymidine phosphorylase
MYLPQELIRSKALGKTLNKKEIDFLIKGIANGELGDSQVGALSMAIFLKGLNFQETSDLTLSMRDSGQVMNWNLNGPVIDKHSTGGVGDLISLVMGPLVASVGGYVPMISGRGLGHTGGTLDKLDSIPGFKTSLGMEEFRKAVEDVHCAIVGQTSELAPADKRFYSIRDITGTVASIPLITASILAKKLAAGLQALCMDVKTGRGAFMESREDSIALAQSITEVAALAGVSISSVVTDMSQPLASCAGNAIEVRYAIEYFLDIKREKRFNDILMKLSSELLKLSGLASDEKSAAIQLKTALESGRATEVFAKMVAFQGGPKDLLEGYKNYLKLAKYKVPILAEKSGFITEIATRDLGLVVVELKGGRKQSSDSIDYSVGLSDFCEIGGRIETGGILGFVWANNENEAKSLAERSKHFFKIGEMEPKLPELIVTTFSKKV